MRVRVEEWGVRGQGLVALYHEPARKRFTVEVFRDGKPKRESVAYRKGGLTQTQARAQAKAIGQQAFLAREEQKTVTQRLGTTKELYERYVVAMDSAWRPATRTSNAYRWRLWQAFIRPESDPDAVTEDTLDDFVRQMRKLQHSPNQIGHTIALVRAVYRLGLRRKWVTESAPITYEFRKAKDDRKLEPEEYHPGEWERLLKVTEDSPRRWRLRAILLVQGSQGMRINAILHLTFADVDLERGLITWPAKWMKQGHDFVQPLTAAGREGVALALAWRAVDRYEGPWLFYSPGRGGVVGRGTGPTHYQTIHTALLKAEARAGITHKPYRSTHGFRRMAAENVYTATGEELTAANWIGDKDVKQLRSYLKRDTERLARGSVASAKATEGRGA